MQKYMGGGKGKKKAFIQNEQLIYENILNDETDQLKTKPTSSFAKSTDTDTRQTKHNVNISL